MINNKYIRNILIAMISVFVPVASGSEDVERVHGILSKENCGGLSISQSQYNQWKSIEQQPVLYAIISGAESCAIRMMKYLSNDDIYSIENKNGILVSAILNDKVDLVSQLLSRRLNFKECYNQLSAAVGLSKNIKIIKTVSEKFSMPCLDVNGKDSTFYSAVYALNYTVIQYYHNKGWIKELTAREKKDANIFLSKQLKILNDLYKLSHP